MAGYKLWMAENAVKEEEHHLGRFLSHFRVDCVFDVGANRGQYRDVLRKRIGYKGLIISYEPLPAGIGEMQKKKAAESDDIWFIEPIALDEVAGEVEFNEMSSDQFSSFHIPSHEEISKFSQQNVVKNRLKIHSGTLADQLSKYHGILKFDRPFLKMDTQGHELSVFKGAGDRYKEFVGLQSELSMRKLYNDSLDYYEVINFYKSRGFELTALVPNNQGHFPDLVELDCIMYRK